MSLLLSRHAPCFSVCMERRAFERCDASIQVKYYSADDLYEGIVENVSEAGMFIRTENFLPCMKSLEVLMPLEYEIACIRVEIRRIEKMDDENLNMGVEITEPAESYLRYVQGLVYALHT